jgi:hypothetical protein
MDELNIHFIYSVRERERSLSSDRPRSYEKGALIAEDSPGSLIAMQAINGCVEIQRVRGGKVIIGCLICVLVGIYVGTIIGRT